MTRAEAAPHSQLLDQLEELSRLADEIEQQPADSNRQTALDVVARERLSVLAQLSTGKRRRRLRWFRRSQGEEHSSLD
jgi:hypothetical protein